MKLIVDNPYFFLSKIRGANQCVGLTTHLMAKERLNTWLEIFIVNTNCFNKNIWQKKVFHDIKVTPESEHVPNTFSALWWIPYYELICQQYTSCIISGGWVTYVMNSGINDYNDIDLFIMEEVEDHYNIIA